MSAIGTKHPLNATEMSAFGGKADIHSGSLSVPSFSGGFAWRKRRSVAGTPMNDSIFHAQPLQTEVFRSARRLVEIEKYFVHRIPTGDDLVDLLIAKSRGKSAL